ncbi:MAG: hypothetical protein HC836_32780 [Richelia sp. RM2_1_2]|nr:hypothetical protein [Richelia sp. RM2_1_2]
MASLADIRAKLLEKESKSNFGTSSGANEIYPFWNIPEGSTATIRFLPDGNTNNTFFWVERLIIRLPFEGVIGQPEAKNVVVQVPCAEMWDKVCPVLSEIRPWFKDPELESLARKYWKKKSYIFQGFVVNNPMDEKDLPESPIRRFVINRSIFEIIRASLMDSEMEEIPTDYQAGRDFKLVKTKRGQYADYTTSAWSMRTRSLSQDELDAIETHGLFDLKDYLPKEPGEKELEIIKEMFEASVNGENYDPSRWASYFKPAGFQAAENDSNVAVPTATKAVNSTKKAVVRPAEVDEDDEVVEETVAVAPTPATVNALDKLKQRISKPETDDETSTTAKATDSGKPDHNQILAMIKNRRKS